MPITKEDLALLEELKKRFWQDHSEYTQAKGLAESDFDFPEDPWKYFVKTKETVMVPLSKVDTIRYREGNRAEMFMKASYLGKGKKRKPVDLKKDGKRYKVMDGNSTVAVAKRYGWNKIPAVIE